MCSWCAGAGRCSRSRTPCICSFRAGAGRCSRPRIPCTCCPRLLWRWCGQMPPLRVAPSAVAPAATDPLRVCATRRSLAPGSGALGRARARFLCSGVRRTPQYTGHARWIVPEKVGIELRMVIDVDNDNHRVARVLLRRPRRGSVHFPHSSGVVFEPARSPSSRQRARHNAWPLKDVLRDVDGQEIVRYSEVQAPQPVQARDNNSLTPCGTTAEASQCW